MRFLFYIPDSPVARGGISVVFDIIEVLNANGIEALALYGRPDFEYKCHVVTAPRVWSTFVHAPNTNAGLKHVARVFRDYALRHNPKPLSNTVPCPEWLVEADDVVIVPEYVADWLPDSLPRHLRLILFNQNPFTLIRAYARPGFKGDRFSKSLSSSEACSAGSRMVFGAEPEKVPLYISNDLYAYQKHKSFQIAYMPRKRGRDSAALIKTLKAVPSLQNIPFVPIDGVSTDEAARLLRESLFFLSLPEREGFGLPAAEAMATGALVIGYTGIGGDEFFNDTSGFPVPEDNLMMLYETVIAVIARYRENPKPLDEFRLQASETILRNYSRREFEQEVIKIFSEFQKSSFSELA
ncbi:glycosyltransferase [Ruegeria sp. R13_0]|uniref:glycosyltransferase n=1 Tax=Ruegeria sp. R13_0 TaxID=2821099 RepID=UPI001ADA8D5A|nr:glycosyltransferase [Ruegeria sp. R13_0]MBO9436754.1 glycosyltransferase [Ruegeria sp. R13_0]